MRWRASPMLRAKVRYRSQPEHYVRRPRLLELLDDAVRAAVTLVVGPPGAGKTVLLAGWAAESSGPTAWLSLDEADADGTELWSGMLAALEDVVPDRVVDAPTVLQRQGGLDRRRGQLLNDLDVEAPRGGARHRRRPPARREPAARRSRCVASCSTFPAGSTSCSCPGGHRRCRSIGCGHGGC